jgi:LCP family protein required for cell wall assembly
LSLHRRWWAPGRVLVALVSAFVIAISGFGWWITHGLLGGMTISHALGLDGPHSTDGAMNILLIGLDSRKDQQGNDLPQDILDQLHAGSSDDGGYNTNTLILVHVDAKNRAVAFSIPRDDYVAVDWIPGYQHIKIKEAYGLTKSQTEQQLVNQGVSDPAKLESQGREAGRASTIKAVRNLTGVPIDYFAEINLAGFYDLANVLGGVQVCLNHAVYDDFSGADFPAGMQTLNAAQALAFVRQRHDLDNGDLDRTHRQQAFLISAMRQLQNSGTFTDIDKLNSLIDVARKDIVLSSGWGEEQFRRLGQIAASGSVQYQTLPVLRYDSEDGQSVNIIDPDEIKAQVAAAFSQNAGPPATNNSGLPSSTVDVINAGGTDGLASTVSQQLSQRGYTAGEVRNPTAGEPTNTEIAYGAGAEGDAHNLGTLLGMTAHSDNSIAPGHIRVTLGADFNPPAALGQGTASTTTRSPAVAMGNSGANSGGDAGDPSTAPPDAGQPISGSAIPCVD